MVVKGIIIIFIIYYFCLYLGDMLGIKIPAGLMSIFLILILAWLNKFNISRIEKASNFLLENLLVFFIPAVVIVYYDYNTILSYGYGLIVSIFLSTALVFILTVFFIKIVLRGMKK